LTRIVFISIPWFSPAFKAGGPIQSIANMVKEMDSGYEFYIFTSNTDLDGLPIAVTTINEWIDFNAYTKVWYAGREKRSSQLVGEIEKIKPDVLYMIGMFSWHFTLVPLFFAKATDKLISVRGMLHSGALQQKSLKKKIFLNAMKLAGVQKKCRFQASDATEKLHIRNVFGEDVNVQMADNFPKILEAFEPADKTKGSLKLVSVGLISPMKNYLLVLQGMKGLEAEIEYNIYGPVKDRNYWEECLAVIRELPPSVKVIYNKELPPHKLSSKLAGNHLFILPSASENFGHAIIEALSSGLPVVTSRHTPWNELETHYAGMNVDTSVKSIAEALCFFIAMDEPMFVRYTVGAAAYARLRFNKKKILSDYKSLFDCCAKVNLAVPQ
jgi:glycosyltransferase involved in cell wall biosynthesis